MIASNLKAVRLCVAQFLEAPVLVVHFLNNHLQPLVDPLETLTRHGHKQRLLRADVALALDPGIRVHSGQTFCLLTDPCDVRGLEEVVDSDVPAIRERSINRRHVYTQQKDRGLSIAGMYIHRAGRHLNTYFLSNPQSAVIRCPVVM